MTFRTPLCKKIIDKSHGPFKTALQDRLLAIYPRCLCDSVYIEIALFVNCYLSVNSQTGLLLGESLVLYSKPNVSVLMRLVQGKSLNVLKKAESGESRSCRLAI